MMLSLLSTFAKPLIAFALNDPDFTGGTNVSGNVDTEIAITDLQVTGTGDPVVPVNLYVPNGTLSMTTTTGLTFTGPSTGSTLQFSGTKSDVNTALASLHYRGTEQQTITLDATLSDASVTYNPATGHLYEVISGSIDALGARTAAATHTQYGLTGYLVTITSQTENDFISSRINTDSWIGASDQDVDTNPTAEGVWKWDQGPEAGTQFWQGVGGSGSVVGSLYNHWAGGEPNNYGSGENCAEFYAGDPYWNDLPCTGSTLSSYIVEYSSNGTPPAVASKSLTITTSYPTPVERNIGNCQTLVDMAADPYTYRYDHLNLTQDLDCAGATLNPLFSMDVATPVSFRGIFNGQGHTISNFVIDQASGQATGLINYSENATVENLTLSNATITGNDACLGGIVGDARNTTIQNVHSSAVVHNASNVNATGGLVGCLNANATKTSTVTASSSSGAVSTMGNSIGGLVGSVSNSQDTASIALTNNTVTSDVTVGNNNYQTGGLLGNFNSGANLTLTGNSVNGSTIDAQSSTGGGLAGRITLSNTAHATISNNTVNVTLIGTQWGECFGGLLGELDTYGTANQITMNDNNVSGDITYAGGRGYDVGGLIGYFYLGDSGILNINRSSSTANVGGEYDAGGLIGYADIENTAQLHIDKSFATGAIKGGNDVGGLIGYLYEYTYNAHPIVSLTNSYSTSAITADLPSNNNSYIGGAIGYVDLEQDGGSSDSVTFTLQNVYSSGDISGNQDIGGLIGYVRGFYGPAGTTIMTMDGTFSTTALTSTDATTTGGLIGFYDNNTDSPIITTKNYWDQTRTGVTVCTNMTSGTLNDCTAVNQTNDQPNYFKIDNAREPLASWDLAHTWGLVSTLNDGLPCLRWQTGCTYDNDTDGVLASVEELAPNSGDANNDGLPDSQQSNVTSLEDPVTGAYAVLQSNCSRNDSVQVSAMSQQNPDMAYSYPAGLMNFTLVCGSVGATATVTQYYYGNFDLSKLILRKWNNTNNTYTTVTGATLTKVTIAGKAALKVVYQIIDGGPLDQDGVANGSIVDPVGPALNTVGAPNTGLSGLQF
jgi:hypothetical protein